MQREELLIDRRYDATEGTSVAVLLGIDASRPDLATANPDALCSTLERGASRERRGRTLDGLPSDETTAEQRLRLTGELHDYTLQSVLAASQGLEAAEDDPQALLFARRSLSRAILELRQLLTALNARPTPDQDVPVGDLRAALLDVIDDTARRGGFCASVRVDPVADRDHPELLHLLARSWSATHARLAARHPRGPLRPPARRDPSAPGGWHVTGHYPGSGRHHRHRQAAPRWRPRLSLGTPPMTTTTLGAGTTQS